MATITPVESSLGLNITKITWTGLSTADTATAVAPAGAVPICGFVQITGTFGGATIVLQGSNDNSNWATLKDTSGTAISVTAAGAADFSTAAAYIRPSSSGGAGDDVNVVVVMRG